MKLEQISNLTQEQKIFLIDSYLKKQKDLEIVDLYKWLYYGEFGYEDPGALLSAGKEDPPLMKLLSEVNSEKDRDDLPDHVWVPMGCSGRFIIVYVTPYAIRECPLKRLLNLMERSPAFRGSRMQFKLDWGLLKDRAIQSDRGWTKRDFYQFEDRISFHSLPDLSYSPAFKANNPWKYRVISQKLFLDYFPEFGDNQYWLDMDQSSSVIGSD